MLQTLDPGDPQALGSPSFLGGVPLGDLSDWPEDCHLLAQIELQPLAATGWARLLPPEGLLHLFIPRALLQHLTGATEGGEAMPCPIRFSSADRRRWRALAPPAALPVLESLPFLSFDRSWVLDQPGAVPAWGWTRSFALEPLGWSLSAPADPPPAPRLAFDPETLPPEPADPHAALAEALSHGLFARAMLASLRGLLLDWGLAQPGLEPETLLAELDLAGAALEPIAAGGGLIAMLQAEPMLQHPYFLEVVRLAHRPARGAPVPGALEAPEGLEAWLDGVLTHLLPNLEAALARLGLESPAAQRLPAGVSRDWQGRPVMAPDLARSWICSLIGVLDRVLATLAGLPALEPLLPEESQALAALLLTAGAFAGIAGCAPPPGSEPGIVGYVTQCRDVVGRFLAFGGEPEAVPGWWLQRERHRPAPLILPLQPPPEAPADWVPFLSLGFGPGDSLELADGAPLTVWIRGDRPLAEVGSVMLG